MSQLPTSIQTWLPLAGGAGTFLFLLTIIRGFQRDFIEAQRQQLVLLDAELSAMRHRLTTIQTELETVRDEQRQWIDAAHALRRTAPDPIPPWIVKLMEGLQ